MTPAGTVSTPGTYGEHPTAPHEAASVPAPVPALPAPDMDSLSGQLGALAGLLAHIDHDMHKLLPKDDVYKVFNLSSKQERLDRFGRAFSRILVGATVSVTVDTGIGNITVNLTAGWNALDYPDGAYISTAGTAANVLYLCSDHQLG